MKIIAALCLLLTGWVTVAAELTRVRTGVVTEIATDRLALREASSSVHIGFVGEKDALTSLGKIRKGDEVRAVFGTAVGPEGRRINKLLSIRLCKKPDAECSADYQRRAAEEKEDARRRELAAKKRERCNAQMQATLSKDPRYVPAGTVAVSNGYLTSYRSLSGQAKQCGAKLLEQHEAAVLEACLLHHCGDNVGGGCWHIAGYASTSTAMQSAVNQCSK
ncbi:MAG: hypothetical protein ACO25T_02755 [Arenimonas sp.]|uniref:hypothetical protein n=1 Tax=Arenimonas sp. TaxID=1872635 RepID=UPI003C06CEC3